MKSLVTFVFLTAIGISNAQAANQYADIVLESYYSGANSNFDTFYGGTISGSWPVIVPTSYAADGNEDTFLSLPTGSYVTLGFSKINIIDAENQDDLKIIETGNGGEDADVYVSSNFKDFVYLGLAQDDVTTSFDLSSINFTDPVVAVMVIGLDSGGGSPGFDVVEVIGLEGSIVETSDQCKNISIIYAKSPNTGKWITFSNPCDLPEGWESSIEKPANDLLQRGNTVVIPLLD